MRCEDYTVGWICAILTEYVAACELLDEEHHPLPIRSQHDNNVYTLGRVGDHNVVIATLPKGEYGIASAAAVAKDMLHSFTGVRIGLMVGIGGGAPTSKQDIRLGDVVVSSPSGRFGGVLHYDLGRAAQDKDFEIQGSLNAPPTVLLTALSKLEATHVRKGHRIAESILAITQRNPRLKKNYECPGKEVDRLFEASYVHATGGQTCDVCCSLTAPPLIERRSRELDEDSPAIHYGLIASGHKLMKDAKIRDKLANEYGVLCFETEAAALMDNFPCVVIRGICDYSDTHKNDVWQCYAAVVAASYAKELLNSMHSRQVKEIPSAAHETKKLGMLVF
jgi:nucleoside phosphorylase